jgi:hypothetical protein
MPTMNDLLKLCRISLIGALVLVSGAQAGTPQELQLRPSDHKEIGDLLQRYFEKLDSPKETEKIRADLREKLEKAGKKLAGKDGDALQAALSMGADLGAAAALSGSQKNLRGGSPEVRKLVSQDAQIEYTLHLPKAYKASSGPYPLVLIAPDVKDGKPMSGEYFLQEFWTDAATRDTVILAVVGMPEDTAGWNKLFVEAGGGRTPGGLFYLMKVYADVAQTVSVDSARVFAAGRGLGVAAVMHLGAMFPQSFAGVIGQAGDSGKVVWQNFQNLPVFLQGGGAEATEFVEKVTAAGYANATASPDAKPEEILAWIQAHPRVSNPAQVTLFPGAPIPNKAYWLEVPPTDIEEGTYVKGSMDRATNTINIEGKGVRSVTLYFNDVLVDMNKPLKVVLNGKEQEVVVPRSLDDFLDLLVRGTSDSARIYVARRSFDLPE